MKKRLLSILTALALCLTLLPAAAGAAGEESNWTYDPGAQTLTNKADTSVVIYNVTVMPWDTTGTQLTIGNNGPGSEGYGSGPFFTGAVLDLTGEIKDASGKSYTIADISSSAFMRCTNLAEVNLPASLSIIKLKTFFGCTALTSVTLPASVKTIESNAFGGCTRLTEITVDEGNPNYCTVDGVLFSRDGSQLIQYPAGKTITQYTVPDGVTHIENSAFSDCTALTSVTLPASVKIIGIGAFSSCLALQTIDLSRCAKLTALSQSAFNNCTALTSITLPASVEVIDNYAFNNCTALTTLTLLSETPPTLGTNALDGCGSLLQILVPPESVEDYKAAQNWIAYADKIKAPPVTVRFHCNGGDDCPMINQSVPYGEPCALAPNPFTHKGYNFTVWTETQEWVGVEFKDQDTVTLTKDLDLYAQWTPHPYTVVFDANGGVGSMEPQELFYDESRPLPLNAFTRTGYTFAGWSTAPAGGVVYRDGQEVSNLTAEENGTVTLYAQWTSNSPTVAEPPVSPGDNSDPSYSVSLPGKVPGGTVTAKKSYAEEGETFRFTVTPEAGYELASLAVTDSAGRELKLTNEGGGEYSFEMPAGRVSFDVTFRPVRTALPFADVDESYWAHDEIAWAYKNGYMSGTSATAFNPGGTVTRQQVWMILARITGETPANMAEAKAWAIANNVSDGSKPGGSETRQQLVTILFRVTGQNGYDIAARADLSGYPDATAMVGYAIEAMAWAVAEGIISGTTAGTLAPGGTVTRAQLAVMLYRWLA